jgi:maltose-binding protein MalE
LIEGDEMLRKSKLLLMCVVLLVCLTVSGFASAQSLEPVDLLIWARDSDTADLLVMWFETWADENAPGSTLQVVPFQEDDLNNQLLTAYPSDLPDIIVDVAEPLASYANAGLLLPLDGAVNTSLYDSDVINAGRVDGTTYGIPVYSGGHTVMVINTSLVGVPSTFDEVIATAQQYNGTGTYGLLFPIEDPTFLLPFAFGFGGSVMDANGNFTLNDAAWVSAFTLVQQLAPVVPVGCDLDCTDHSMADGNAAIAITDDVGLGSLIISGLEDSIAVVPFPPLSNGQSPRAFVHTEYASLTINATDAKYNAALAFLNWVTTDSEVATDAATDFGRLPAATALQSISAITGSPLLSGSLAAYQNGVMLPANTHVTCMWDALGEALDGVLAGSTTPQDAASIAQQLATDCALNQG